MAISENLKAIASTLPAGVTLVAVSKFHPAEAVMEAYNAGQRIFGESRAAELTVKAAALPDDIEWHFIGHLQSNKVKPVVAAATVIQSIDSERLLRRVDAEATATGRRIKVLLQAHVAREETKFGLTPEEMLALVTPDLPGSLKSTTISGIMGMASNTDDTARVRADFLTLKQLFDTLATGPMTGHPEFNTLSMGMSHDRGIAVECGSTMVRIGTDIFGERQY